MVSVSFAAIFIRWTDSHPVLVGAYRMSLATLIFVPWAARGHMVELAGLWRRHRCRLGRMALVGVVLGLHFATFIWAVKLTSVAAAVLLVTCHPLFVAPLGHHLFGERVGRMGVVGIVSAFGGMVLLVAGSHTLGFGDLIGNLLAVAGGVAAGVYLMAGRRIRVQVSLPVYALVVYGLAAVTLWVLAVALAAMPAGAPGPAGMLGSSGELELEPGDLLIVDGREWALFTALALVPTLGGHTMQNWALRHVPAYWVSVTLLGEPVGSVLLAIPLLGEWPAWVELGGGTVILLGIGLTLFGEQLSPEPPP